MERMDPLRELERVAAQYDKYLELSQVNQVQGVPLGYAYLALDGGVYCCSRLGGVARISVGGNNCGAGCSRFRLDRLTRGGSGGTNLVSR